MENISVCKKNKKKIKNKKATFARLHKTCPSFKSSVLHAQPLPLRVTCGFSPELQHTNTSRSWCTSEHLRIQFGLFLIESAGEAKKVQYQCRDSLHRPSRAGAIPAQPSTAALSPAHSLRQAARQPETPLSPELDYCLTFLPSLQLPLC